MHLFKSLQQYFLDAKHDKRKHDKVAGELGKIIDTFESMIKSDKFKQLRFFNRECSSKINYEKFHYDHGLDDDYLIYYHDDLDDDSYHDDLDEEPFFGLRGPGRRRRDRLDPPRPKDYKAKIDLNFNFAKPDGRFASGVISIVRDVRRDDSEKFEYRAYFHKSDDLLA